MKVIVATDLKRISELDWSNEPGGCPRCYSDAILADTEDWKLPACYDCWEVLGRKEPADS